MKYCDIKFNMPDSKVAVYAVLLRLLHESFYSDFTPILFSYDKFQKTCDGSTAGKTCMHVIGREV